jgi:hypothetical protein
LFVKVIIYFDFRHIRRLNPTMAVNILKFGTSSPADTTLLKALKAAGYDSTDILAVIGKTEGAISSFVLSCCLQQYLLA